MTPFAPWIHGAPDEPPLQAQALDAGTHVLRIAKSYSFEANFLYLLTGRDRALLLDTGGPPDPGGAPEVLPLREKVDAILAAHPRGAELDLVVAHTHTHGDHVWGDPQFAGRPRTTLVGHSLEEVTTFWALPGWPEGEATFDLGDRPLTVLPIPGHESRHIALHDPRTGILITGDLLYPGLLTVRDWPAFRASARRLAAFARARRVTAVLGCHIEMSRHPGRLYAMGARVQPEEHPLPLSVADIEELHALCERLGDHPRDAVLDRFAIQLVRP